MSERLKQLREREDTLMHLADNKTEEYNKENTQEGEVRGWSAENLEEMTKIQDEIGQVQAEIKMETRQEELRKAREERQALVTATEVEPAKQNQYNDPYQRFGHWVKYGEIDGQQTNRLRMYMPGFENDENKRAAMVRAVSTTTLTANLLPQEVATDVMQNLYPQDPMREIARVISTPHGREYRLPLLNVPTSSGNIVAAGLTAEAAASTEYTPGIGSISLGAYTIRGHYLVSEEAVEDSPFEILPALGATMGEWFGNRMGDFHSNGSGSSTFSGIKAAIPATGSTFRFNSAHTSIGNGTGATVFNLGVLKQVIARIASRYRAQSRFMLTFSTLMDLQSIVEYPNGPSIVSRANGTIFGFPYVLNEHVQSFATDAATGTVWLYFGDLGNFIIRDVAAIDFVRNDTEFVNTGQTAVYFRYRGDSIFAKTNVTNLTGVRKA